MARPDGTLTAIFVATNSSNATIGTLHMLLTVEHKVVDPIDPSAYRRPVQDPAGVFAEPAPVLWVVRTNATGGCAAG